MLKTRLNSDSGLDLEEYDSDENQNVGIEFPGGIIKPSSIIAKNFYLRYRSPSPVPVPLGDMKRNTGIRKPCGRGRVYTQRYANQTISLATPNRRQIRVPGLLSVLKDPYGRCLMFLLAHNFSLMLLHRRLLLLSSTDLKSHMEKYERKVVSQ